MDRADAVERRREREAAEQLGLPEPRLNRWELKRAVAEREAAKGNDPGDAGRVVEVVSGGHRVEV